MCAPRRSLPWNRKFVHTFGDLVVSLSRSRCISLMGRILMKQYIQDCTSSKFEYCRSGSEHLFILDNYKYFEREDGERIYNPCPKIVVYETPMGHLDLSWHFVFTRTDYNSTRLLKMVSIRCATCGEDTGETMADNWNMDDIFNGNNFYCTTCKRKVSMQTRDAAKKGLPGKWTNRGTTGDEISELEELLIIAKQLSGKDVTPRVFA